MSRTTHFGTPAAALAVFMTAAVLVIPVTAVAQTVSGEQAMLNRSIEHYVGAVRILVAQSGSEVVDGAQALLGRSLESAGASSPAGRPVAEITQPCPLDGARALLGTCVRDEAQRHE